MIFCRLDIFIFYVYCIRRRYVEGTRHHDQPSISLYAELVTKIYIWLKWTRAKKLLLLSAVETLSVFYHLISPLTYISNALLMMIVFVYLTQTLASRLFVAIYIVQNSNIRRVLWCGQYWVCWCALLVWKISNTKILYRRCEDWTRGTMLPKC